MNVVWMVLGALMISGAWGAAVFWLLTRAKDLPEGGFGSRCDLDAAAMNGGCCPDACAGCVYSRKE